MRGERTKVAFKVIFNADDFGASARVNEAIARCHLEGSLTSASLMVNEPGAEEAAALARSMPRLDVGLHLALSNGSSATGGGRRLPRTPFAAGLAYGLSGKARLAMQIEMREQFARFAAFGLSPMRVDGHQHLHLHPAVWSALLRTAREFGVRAIRIPNENAMPPNLGSRLEAAFLRALRRHSLRSLSGRHIFVAERVHGHAATGNFHEERLLTLLDRVGDGVSEFYFHPGGARTRRLHGHADDVETEALLSSRIAERLSRGDVEATTYREVLLGVKETAA